MNGFAFKYSKQIGSITLISYLLICILSVFHFHHFELKTSPVLNDNQRTDFTSQISLTESGCIILQNLNSLHSFTFTNTTSRVILNSVCSSCSFESCNQSINNPQLSLVSLRAPPAFS